MFTILSTKTIVDNRFDASVAINYRSSFRTCHLFITSLNQIQVSVWSSVGGGRLEGRGWKHRSANYRAPRSTRGKIAVLFFPTFNFSSLSRNSFSLQIPLFRYTPSSFFLRFRAIGLLGLVLLVLASSPDRSCHIAAAAAAAAAVSPAARGCFLVYSTPMIPFEFANVQGLIFSFLYSLTRTSFLWPSFDDIFRSNLSRVA